jgi:hypothetical protein
MASRDTRSAPENVGQDQDPAGAGRVGDPEPLASSSLAAEIELSLSDLISDERGEVVLFNDSEFRTLALRAGVRVVAKGLAARHVTASGEDVTGFQFVTFENGVTLYYQRGLDLVVQPRGVPRAR